MRIGRLEFGTTIMANTGKPAWDEPLFQFETYCCGCKNVGFWIFFVTWLSDECYYPCNDPECPCQQDDCVE